MNMQIMIILSILGFTSCAHRTIHEECTMDETWKRYGTLDRCYDEKMAEREAETEFWMGVNQGMSQPAPEIVPAYRSSTTRCSSFGNQTSCRSSGF